VLDGIWSISICGFDYRLKMARTKGLSSETRQSILVLRNEGYSMREITKKLKISFNTVYYSLHRTAQTGSNQNIKSGGAQCTTEQEYKYIRVSSLRNRCLTSPQLAASLNNMCKTPVSTSTVKRRLWDAGLLGRVAKKMPYLRMANKKKRLRCAKEHRHQTEELYTVFLINLMLF
jgi:transposase